MMDFDEITYKINADNGYNTRFMLSSADGKVIWVMEGMATSNWTESWLYGTPWSLRCVRYLRIGPRHSGGRHACSAGV